MALDFVNDGGYVVGFELFLLREFDDFSGMQSFFSFFFTALNFCFFCFKTKERTEIEAKTCKQPDNRLVYCCISGHLYCAVAVVAVGVVAQISVSGNEV